MTTPSKMVMRISTLLILSFLLTIKSYSQTLTLSTPSVVATSSVCVSTNSVTCYTFRLSANSCACIAGHFTGLTIRNTGTAVLGTDVTNFKLWAGSVGGTLLSTLVAGSSFPAFSSLFIHTPGTTTNFFITADIPGGAGDGKTIIIDASPIITTDITADQTTNGAGTESGGTITIKAVPTAIIGATAICAGSSTALSEAASGGIWNSDNTTVATVNTNTGDVTAGVGGVAHISYSNNCGSAVTTTITVAPDAGVISGLASVCPGGNVTLSDNVPGGVWSSTNTTAATISGLGVVTGLSGGVTTISYLQITGCGSVAATYSFTVTSIPDPGTITGQSIICTGTPSMLSDAVLGGVWSISNPALGTVSGNTVTATAVGLDTVSYSVTNICSTSVTIFPMTFSPPPNPGSIFGPASVCAGSTIWLSDLTPGGIWSTANTNTTVSGAGQVTGVSAGPATISYTSTTACASLSALWVISVDPLPVAGTITGPSAVCAGSSIPLTDAASGGVWSSSNTNTATVDGFGNVTGVASGLVTINYSATTPCGTQTITHPVTVNPVPVVAGITGSSSVCVGDTVVVSDVTSDVINLWSSSNTNITTIPNGGGLLVIGASAGTSTISYTVTNGFGCSATVTTIQNINPLPLISPISGSSFTCVGLTTMLSDAGSAGVWSSTNTAIATVDAVTGAVTGITTGAFTISYSITTFFGCNATMTFDDTVHTIPSQTATAGIMTVCEGSTVTLTNPAAGGVWSSSNTHASVSPSGDVTGAAAGTDYIIYAVSNTCGTVFDSALVTINAVPSVTLIMASATTICASSSIMLSESTSGGVWSSSDTTIAKISAAGVVSGIAPGNVSIAYTVTNGVGCSITTGIAMFIGIAMPPVTLVPGATATLCHGNPVNLEVMSAGSGITYQWLNGGAGIPGATDSAYMATTAGTYMVVLDNGTCSQAFPAIAVTAAPNPVISFTAPDILYTGSFSTYKWFLNGVLIPGATSSLIHTTSGGDYTVVAGDLNGCTDTSVVYTLVTAGINNVATAHDVRIYPNPASSVLHIAADVKVNVSVYGIDGKLLISQKDADNINVRELANGMYIIMIYDENNVFIKTAKFTKAE